MEDSSQNPYIPQESEQIREKVYERQSPLGRIVKWSLIASLIVAVLVAIGLFFVVPRTTAVDKDARIKLANALQSPSQSLKRVNVSSDLGFKLNYDNLIYNSYAEVGGDSSAGSDTSTAVQSGQTYENNDLRVARAYNYIRIRPIQSVDSSRDLTPLPPEFELFATVSDSDLTKAAAVPENKGLSKLSLFVKLDGDKRAAKKITDDKTIVAIDSSKPVSATIGNVTYQKVRYTTTNDNHRVSNVKYDDCYYTIQNKQPFSLCISNVRPTNVSAASLVEQVFDTITFVQPAQSESSESDSTEAKKTSALTPSIKLAQSTKNDTKSDSAQASDDDTDADQNDTQSPLLTITPPYYSDGAILSSFARNQPSVVRIGTIYCADLALNLPNGNTATTLTDACVGNQSTGTFISSDGYIATSGHAIRTQKEAAINGYINSAADQDQLQDRLGRVLDYLMKAQLILQSDADYLKSGASLGGDQEALAKIQNIGSIIPNDYVTAVKEEYTYAIQPTDKPIVVNRSDSNKPSFAYSDSVISAKYVASHYEADKSVQETFDSQAPSVDVGLLKAEGSYPEVSIASSENLKANDNLTTIGFPSYTDSSLAIDKDRNAPVASSSKVEQVYTQDDGRLVQTDNPVLPGNDGAPVFDNQGQLVGLAVYGFSYCPDKLCFANGTVRPSAELTKLVKEKNITLAKDNKAAADWDSGVTEFMRANYSASSSAFALAGSEYPFNQWAKSVTQLASSMQGSTMDTSLMNQLQFAMIIVLVAMIIITIILAILYAIHRQRLSQLRVGHYGAATSAPTQTYSTQPQPVPAPLPPVQNPYEQTPQPPTVQGQAPQPQYPPQPQSPQQPYVQPNPPSQPQQNQPEDPFYK